MPIDPYWTLGLQPGATAAEVKRAYRRLAKASHPDAAGQAALDRFLAIQEAYEELTNRPRAGRAGRSATARPGSGGSGAAAAGGAAAGEPWRADPARARAAREQASARSRGATPGTGSGAASGAAGPAAAGSGTAGGSSGAASGGARPGTAGARAGGSTSTRKRAPRKATMGSTSYDEARDASDTSWAGASWYGPTSGEYWRVNPHEYADPRKHGPEYQSRARRRSTTTGQAWDAEPSDGEAAATARPDTGRGRPDAREDDRGDPMPHASGRTWATPPRDAEPREVPPPGATASAESGDATFAETIAWLGRRLDREPNDPVRRLGYALVAWAPLGLAVAALIGGATGCASYGAACTGAAPMIPWLVQAAILGLLLLLPRLARILATGTAAVLLALAPLTALLIAFGGSGEPSAPGILQTLLTVIWIGGVAIGVYAVTRIRPTETAAR